MSNVPQISLIIPIYCEAEILPELIQRTRQALSALGRTYELIFVDDGSHDQSAAIVTDAIAQAPEIRLVQLSRNFGLQPAVSAGLAHARGDIVGLMDGDLQDPPELFGEMLATIEQGYDVVYMIKRSRKETLLRRLGFWLFYWLFKRLSTTPLPPTAGLFSLMRRHVVHAILACPERNKFVPGLRTWVGFRQVSLAFDRQQRPHGEPRQTLGKLIRLATDALYAFSDIPLKIALFLGLGTAMVSLLAVVIVSSLRVFTTLAIPGWASTLVAIFFMGGVQLICIGILGEYLSRIYDEVRRRPQYVVQRVIDAASPGDDPTVEAVGMR